MLVDGVQQWCSIYGPDADHLYKEIKVGEEITVEGSYPQKQKTRGPKIFSAKSVSTKYYISYKSIIERNYGSVAAYNKAKQYRRRVEQLRPAAYEVQFCSDRDVSEQQMTNDQYAKLRFYNLEIDKRSLTDGECRDILAELGKSIAMQDKLRKRVEDWKTIAGSLQKRLPDDEEEYDNE